MPTTEPVGPCTHVNSFNCVIVKFLVVHKSWGQQLCVPVMLSPTELKTVGDDSCSTLEEEGMTVVIRSHKSKKDEQTKYNGQKDKQLSTKQIKLMLLAQWKQHFFNYNVYCLLRFSFIQSDFCQRNENGASEV